MRVAGRRKSAVFFLVLGICLIVLAAALYVGWILLSLQQIVFMILGIIFFSLIITGLVLNTLFLIREIKRNEQHNAFLNAVTHELKTPIASIRLYLETLQQREVAPEKRREFYATMLADSDRLINTVEQVLRVSSLREKKRLQDPTRIDLNMLIAECIERVRSRYNLDEGAFDFTRVRSNTQVIGDRPELQAVFTNLLDNAIKYSPDDKKVLVSVRESRDAKVDIRIKDFGVGIPRAELKRIFRRFYRVPGLSTQKTKGTGLGLFIVASVVKMHGGKIWAESMGEGRGTRFIVRLPRADNL